MRSSQISPLALVLWLLALALALANAGCATSDVITRTTKVAIETPFEEAHYNSQARGEDAQGEFNLLMGVATHLGYTVSFVERTDGNVGINYSQRRLIEIESTMPLNARVETLAHELGHAMHPPFMFNAREAEWFAELTAVEVLRRIGYPVDPKVSGTYLAGIKMASYIATVYRKDIERAASALVAAAGVGR